MSGTVPGTIDSWLLVVQAAATWFMTGLIWFVQVVHYPLFDGVGPSRFADYEARHVSATGRVVGPPMLVEACLAVVTVFRPPAGVPAWQAWAGLALVLAIWLSTALRQVPAHRVLEAGFDPAAHATLVRSNRLRVVAWTLRALLVASWLA